MDTQLLPGLLLGVMAGGLVAWLAARGKIARLEERAAAERRAAGEKLALLEQAELKLREAFASLAAEALRQNNQSFLALAQTKLGEFQQSAASDLEKRQKAVDDLVRPIQEALVRVDGKLQEVEKDRIASYAGLTEQVKAMAQSQQALQSETGNLVKALRTPQVRGRWGEVQLKRVVEMAGMLDYCDFQEQASVETADGRLRPDLIVRLPGGKTVVVDAKAPLAAYLDAVDGNLDDGARELLLKDHARQVRDHMVSLSGKAYWNQFQPAPDFVVMFLPGETFFSAACQHDPSLIEFGVSQQVIPASPPRSSRCSAPSPTAGGRSRSPGTRRRSASSAGCSTSGSAPWPDTSRTSVAGSTRQSRATTRRRGRWRPECWSRRGGSRIWGRRQTSCRGSEWWSSRRGGCRRRR
jgi:DNA recombination protein RmuC